MGARFNRDVEIEQREQLARRERRLGATGGRYGGGAHRSPARRMVEVSPG